MALLGEIASAGTRARLLLHAGARAARLSPRTRPRARQRRPPDRAQRAVGAGKADDLACASCYLDTPVGWKAAALAGVPFDGTRAVVSVRGRARRRRVAQARTDGHHRHVHRRHDGDRRGGAQGRRRRVGVAAHRVSRRLRRVRGRGASPACCSRCSVSGGASGDGGGNVVDWRVTAIDAMEFTAVEHVRMPRKKLCSLRRRCAAAARCCARCSCPGRAPCELEFGRIYT